MFFYDRSKVSFSQDIEMSDDNNDDDGAFFISCSQIIYKHSDWCGGKESIRYAMASYMQVT